MTRWDVPLLNQREERSNSLISTELFRDYAKHIIENQLAWHHMMRVAELRRLCGAEPRYSTVNVRLPPRYLKNADA